MGEGKSWQWGRGSQSHGDGKFWVGKWMMEFRMDDGVAIFGYDDSRTGNRSGRRAFTGQIQMGKIGMEVEWL